MDFYGKRFIYGQNSKFMYTKIHTDIKMFILNLKVFGFQKNMICSFTKIQIIEIENMNNISMLFQGQISYEIQIIIL